MDNCQLNAEASKMAFLGHSEITATLSLSIPTAEDCL